jgi:hypothetical protein
LNRGSPACEAGILPGLTTSPKAIS